MDGSFASCWLRQLRASPLGVFAGWGFCRLGVSPAGDFAGIHFIDTKVRDRYFKGFNYHDVDNNEHLNINSACFGAEA